MFLSLLLHKDKTYFVFFSSLVMKQRLTNRLFSNTTDHLSVRVSSLKSLFFQGMLSDNDNIIMPPKLFVVDVMFSFIIDTLGGDPE